MNEKQKQLEYFKVNNQKQAQKYKMYSVKIPKYQAEILDKLLKENREKFADIVKKAVEKYINNNQKIL